MASWVKGTIGKFQFMRLFFQVMPGKMTFHSFFFSRIVRYKFWWDFYIHMRSHHYFDNKSTRWIAFLFCQKTSTSRTITSNTIGAEMQKSHSRLTFFLSGLFLQAVMIHSTAGDMRRPSFFHSTISISSQKVKHLFAVLKLRWLPSIFNHNACKFHTKRSDGF